MFGRKKQQQQEATREAERRALFEDLAKRPDTICPFLGLESARSEYRDRVSDGHRCYAFGDPAELSAEQQQKVCLQRGYGNCPRYLRGVLVIPTEELEALRHPKPAPPPPAPPPVPAASGGGGGRRGLVVALVLLLLVVGGGAAFLALKGETPPVARETPTPMPTPMPTTEATGTVPETPGTTPTTAESLAPTPLPTPIVLPSVGPTIPPLPTPGPDDTSTGYSVWVVEGEYPVFRLDENNQVVGEATAIFGAVSAAPVARIDIDGTTYWLTLVGDYAGLAYVRGTSGGFEIYETYVSNETIPTWGTARYRRLPEDLT